MRVVDTGSNAGRVITEFNSIAARSSALGRGGGEAHAYVVSFEPGGSIGPHAAGFGQLFVPILGSGWAAGEDGERRQIAPGQVAYVRRGEIHSKGSDEGMTAVMVQIFDLEVEMGQGWSAT